MTFFIVSAVGLLIAFHFGGRFYLVQAKRYTDHSVAVWARLTTDTEAFIADDEAPEKLVAFVYAVSMQAGCGCVTNRMLIDLVLGRFLRKIEKPKDNSFAEVIATLNEDQSRRLSQILSSALLFDSLQVPLRGVIVRRALWWMHTVVTERDKGLDEAQLERVALSARHALKPKIAGLHHQRDLVAC